MPIFEYHCTKCDKDFEALVLGSQKVACPHCSGEKVEKLLSCCSFKTAGAASASGSGEGGFSSSKVSACASCSATSCKTCGH
ncbi:MAG: zinc ribbon domain-containing protein [Thermodesulfobacteriota bacterium]|nr:zinc ribbon domain-containing protein [Thermodesulfobacteriota bacterium]